MMYGGGTQGSCTRETRRLMGSKLHGVYLEKVSGR